MMTTTFGLALYSVNLSELAASELGKNLAKKNEDWVRTTDNFYQELKIYDKITRERALAAYVAAGGKTTYLIPALAEIDMKEAEAKAEAAAATKAVAPTARPSFFTRYKKTLLVGGAVAVGVIGVGVALFVRKKN